MNLIKSRLLYAGLEKADFDRMIPLARHENTGKLKTCALISLVLFLFFCAATLISRIFPLHSAFVYAVMALCSGGLYVLARLLPPRFPSATTFLCYSFIAALYLFSLIDAMLHPDLPAVVAIAVMLMGPFLFTERPIHLIGMNLLTILLLCVISFCMKTRELALIDFWNALAFGFVSIAAELMQERLRFRLLYNADRVKYLSETDVLTGCKNRNCYQERLSRFSQMCRKNLVCVYVDVNGLHNLNDSQGHEAGDRMLCAVARALLDAFGSEHTYRIGGDEFVVMRMDQDTEEIRQIMADTTARVSAQGYDISVGIADADQGAIDMGELTKRAEADMYRQKQAYYAQEGHQRRKGS